MAPLPHTPVRRVVTGHDANGKAIVVSDGEPPLVVKPDWQPGLSFTEIWNTKETPAPVENGPDPIAALTGASPHIFRNGTTFRIVEIPPEGPEGPPLSKEQAEALFNKVGHTRARSKHQKTSHPLMHRTETLDYGIVLSGEIHLVLDDSEVHLRPGDVVIQRGTIHAWHNKGDVPCRMIFIIIDGKFGEDVRGLLKDVL